MAAATPPPVNTQIDMEIGVKSDLSYISSVKQNRVVTMWCQGSLDNLIASQDKHKSLYCYVMKRLFKKQMNKRPNKKRRLILIAAVILGSGLLVYSATKYVLYRMPCGGYSDNALYYDVASAIKDSDQEAIQKYVEKIESQRNYESSVNCLYPLFYASIKNSDPYQAEQYFAQMQEAVNTEDISEAYSTVGFSQITDAKKQLDKLINSRINNYNEFLF